MLSHHNFITCPLCNSEILVVPDVQAMSKAVNTHVRKHNIRKQMERAKLVNNMSQQILVVISQIAESVHLPVKVWLLIESYFGSKRVHGVALTAKDAEAWVDAKLSVDPQGSFFFDTAEVVKGGNV